MLCVISGDYGKPRPAVVVQSDLFNPTHASVTICPMTSHLIEASLFRLPVAAAPDNGLRDDSQIMVDKLATIKIDKLRNRIGRLSPEQIAHLDEALKLWLELL